MKNYRGYQIALVNTLGIWFVMVWSPSGELLLDMDMPKDMPREEGFKIGCSYVNQMEDSDWFPHATSRHIEQTFIGLM